MVPENTDHDDFDFCRYLGVRSRLKKHQPTEFWTDFLENLKYAQENYRFLEADVKQSPAGSFRNFQKHQDFWRRLYERGNLIEKFQFF